MKHTVSVKAFNIGDELQELYWFAGTTFNDRSECIIRPIIKGVESGKFRMCHLPIGVLPYLTIGRYFDKGQIIDMTMRGTIDTILIENMSSYVEITSAAIPPTLYSFDEKNTGKQRLLRYEIDGLEVFIPTIELIRYLFLHNKTLANALMRPNGLMTLFNPQTPGFNKELKLDFTSDMPRSSLTNDFAQEFAWLAMDVDARKSWDSVMSLSLDQTYLTLNPPALKNSKLQFRGISEGKQIIVLEILKITGKIQPCDKLIYSHPSMKQVVRLDTSDTFPINLNNDKYQDSTDSSDRYEYDFEVVDDGNGATNLHNPKSLNIALKRSSFERQITIERSFITDESCSKVSGGQGHTTKTTKKILKVSAGDISLDAVLAPIEFNLLIPGTSEHTGDLDVMEEVVKQMSLIVPSCQFSMAICQLKQGRSFSTTNRHSRHAMIVTIISQSAPPIYLLDVDHSGNIALSLLAVSFKASHSFEILEPIIKTILDGLIDNGGHWDGEIHSRMESQCSFERFPKLISPRILDGKSKTAVWATKLAYRLGLMTTL